ncbi:hypothetical protein B0H17DRAFT_1202603 [Mycena rosella]|uniref:Uncharacterized protein n=1 Tax=Mycena rosella TaxID=1033263 RepID=A0AAD7DFF2_MYCRO|nr:hypothetical protein B0H17DRAFT_1202603 [Mycena rosella]
MFNTGADRSSPARGAVRVIEQLLVAYDALPVFSALPAAPNLSSIAFAVPSFQDKRKPSQLDSGLQSLVSDQTKRCTRARYPRFQRLTIRVWSRPLSYFHYTRAIRRKMGHVARRDMACLGWEGGVEWFDLDDNHVLYRENGTPSYGVPAGHEAQLFPAASVDAAVMLGLL